MAVRVELPNGQTVDVNTDDDNVARARAFRHFRETDPQGYGAWEQGAGRNRPLAGGVESFFRSMRQTAGTGVGGIAPFGERLGFDMSGVRDVATAITGEDNPRTRTIQSASEFGTELLRQPGAAIGQLAGQSLGSIAAIAPVVGLGAAAAPLVGAGAAAGAIAAGIGSGALMGTGELEQNLLQEGVAPDRARNLATTAGAGIGAVEGGVGGLLLGNLFGRQIRREAVGTLSTIAARGSLNQGARAAGGAALLEGGSEFAGEAARQGVAAAETGNLNLARRIDQAALEGIAGGLGGGAIGGATGALAPGRARAELNRLQPPADPNAVDPNAPPPPEPAPLPEGVLPLLPEPTPFTTPEEAAAFLDAPEAEIARRPQSPFTTPEAQLQYANDLQVYETNVENEQRRANALIRFVGGDAVLEPQEGQLDRAPQAGTLIPQLAQLAVNGDINLLSFNAKDIATQALLPLGVEPNGGNIRYVAQQLRELAKADFIEHTGKGSYSITNRDTSGLAFKVNQKRGPSSVQTPPVILTGDPLAGPPSIQKREDARAVFAAPAQEDVLAEVNSSPQKGKLVLDSLFVDREKPNVSYRDIQKAFRERNVIVDDATATALYKKGIEYGVFTKTGKLARLLNGDASAVAGPVTELPTPAAPLPANVLVAANDIATKRGRPFNSTELAAFASAFTEAKTKKAKREVVEQFFTPEVTPTPNTEAQPTVAETPAPVGPSEATAQPTTAAPPQAEPQAAAPAASPAQSQPVEQAVEPTSPAEAPATASAEPSGAPVASPSTVTAPSASTAPPIVNPIPAPTLPTNTKVAQQVVQKATRDFIVGPLKWFGSPIMGLGRTEAALAPASAVQQNLLDIKGEGMAQLEAYIDPFAKLPDSASKVKVTRAWELASRTQKAPNTNGFTQEEKTALTEAVAGLQRAFDWFIESKVISMFQPNKTTQPATRTKMEAFWAKNQGKHLWEIPTKELQAVSPEGYAEMQRLNKMRNPYYMPMIADGSHFVAAYKTNAKGEKAGPPIRLIPYTPPNAIQRMRGQSSQEADALAQLRAEFPAGSKVYITPQGQQFTSNKEAQKVRSDGDFISEYLSQLANLPSMASSQQAQNLLGSMMRALDKAQIDRILTPNQDVLRPINKKNEDSYVLDMVPRYLAGVVNIAARNVTQKPFVDAIEGLTENDKQYLRDLRDYSTTPTEAFGGLRTLTFFTLLGGAIDTALINLLQPFQISGPMLMRDGGNFINMNKHLTSSYGVITKSMSQLRFKGGKNIVDLVSDNLTDAAERAAYQQALKIGVLQPLYTNESRGQISASSLQKLSFKNPAGTAQALNSLARAMGQFQQQSEQSNRAVSFLTAYRMAKDNPDMIARANKLDNLKLATPYDYAVYKTNQTNFLTSKEDRALIQRFTPIAEVATQFMSFPLKTAELMVRNWNLATKGIDNETKKAGVVGLLAMVTPLVALGGVFALPGADTLKEALEAIIKEVWGSTANFEADMRRSMGGGFLAESVINGIPHASGVASLRRRVAIDPVPFNDITSGSIMSFVGPAGAIPEQAVRFYNYLKLGDYWNAAASAPFMPRAVGNVVRGADLGVGTGEIRSARGNTLLSPDQIKDIDSRHLVPSAIRAAIGFQSPEVMSAREWFARHEELRRLNQVATERASNEIAGHLTRGMRRQAEGDTEGAQQEFNRAGAARQRIGEQNARFAEEGQHERILNIQDRAINRRAIADFQGRSSEEQATTNIPKSARQRALEDYRLYNPQATPRFAPPAPRE